MLRGSRLQLGFTLIELSVVTAIIAVLDVAVGQTAKLNVVFVPAVQLPAVQLPAVQCTVDLKISDNNGNVVASSTETLLPNQSKSISFDNLGPAAGAPAGDPTAVEYHASVAIPSCPDNSNNCSRQERQLQGECLAHRTEFASSLELIDDGTHKALVALPGVPTELTALAKGESAQGMRE